MMQRLPIPRGAAAAALVATTTLLLAGCAVTLREEARRAAGEGGPTTPVVEALRTAHDAIDATKRIFEVTLVEGGRRFAGEGALVYEADPRRLVADVFGPHDAHVLHVELVGDRLTVRLPQEGEVMRGELGDPEFARLTGERALVRPEILGALLGAYDIDRLLEGADRVAARGEGERRTLYVVDGEVVHALTIAPPPEDGGGPVLVGYRQERDGTPVYRVQFDEFHRVDGRWSPWRVVLRDFAGDRWIVAEVRSERADVSVLPRETGRFSRDSSP